jgi:hypothetical protein
VLVAIKSVFFEHNTSAEGIAIDMPTRKSSMELVGVTEVVRMKLSLVGILNVVSSLDPGIFCPKDGD